MTVRTVAYAEPTNVASTPRTFLQVLRRLIFGNPLASTQLEDAAVRKLLALPIFASDAISSVAYATQQILLALSGAGLWLASRQSQYAGGTILISCLIVALLSVVVSSYWQTIFAYPNGGGSYAVSKSNFGTTAGLVAAAALSIDYVLTVSVSVASGVQNLCDMPLIGCLHVREHMVVYCLFFVALLIFANLRGLKESGPIFAMPTYIFVFMCYLMIGLAIIGPLFGWQFHSEFINQTVPVHLEGSAASTLGLAVLLRAFANGCSAMTGIEAVSNGVPAFQEPRPKNAALTLVAMGCLLGTIFLGISWLAVHFHVVYWQAGGMSAPAVIDQLSGTIFGKSGQYSALYVITQVFTALILLLAANTSFAGFPRLASILARDGFMPRQLASLGDKLVFNNGIITLGILAGLLIIIKQGSVDQLIPLYAIGVFLAFTMSQAGMVKHWLESKEKGWRYRMAINGVGAVATGIVLIDIAAEKFADGAWFVLVLVILLIAMFKKIHAHYAAVSDQLRAAYYQPFAETVHNTVLVLAQGVSVGTMKTLEYARSLSADFVAVHVDLDADQTAGFKKRWQELLPGVPLVILESPYRSLLAPIMHYLDVIRGETPNHRITIIIGEFVPTKWWHTLLHGNTGMLLKLALLNRRDVVVTNVRYYLQK